MKGVVFTEFIEMVEDQFGFTVADEIISESDLPSGGAYTAVGTYDHKEIVALVVKLSEKSGTPVTDLLKHYGKYLFERLVTGHQHIEINAKNSFEFLCMVEDHIHVEVKKLYPEAELPSFDAVLVDENTLELVYHSSRKFGHLALGLIEGCIDHFGEEIEVSQENLVPDGSVVQFRLERK